jgi:hypothetical protein
MTRKTEGWMRRAEAIVVIVVAIALLLGYLYNRFAGG